jgi:hypothetical protein
MVLDVRWSVGVEHADKTMIKATKSAQSLIMSRIKAISREHTKYAEGVR